MTAPDVEAIAASVAAVGVLATGITWIVMQIIGAIRRASFMAAKQAAIEEFRSKAELMDKRLDKTMEDAKTVIRNEEKMHYVHTSASIAALMLSLFSIIKTIFL